MSTSSPTDPRSKYQDLLIQRERAVAALERRDARIALMRLGIFVTAGAILGATYWLEAVRAWWAAGPGLLFLGLIIWHEQVIQRKARAERAAEFYRRGLDRLDERWSGKGNQRVDLVDEDHPYAADLDLFGLGSLFELLCSARTGSGQETLARWLLAPSPVDTLRDRQAAVDELRARLDLRETVWVLGQELAQGVSPARLLAWVSARAPFARAMQRVLPLLGLGLGLAAVATLVLWFAASWGPWPFVVVVALEWIVNRLTLKRLQAIVAPVDRAAEELELLARLLDLVAREPLSSPRLQALKQAVQTDGQAAVVAVRALARRVTWLHAQDNQMFAPFAFVLMWGLQLGLAIERWRRRHGGAIARWLEVAGELEALLDLAAYAYERPADPWPELVEPGPVFDGRAVGHPLIPDATCVRNDVQLGTRPALLLISGSNMSGKTTLLRSVGINTVLALAGAPVRARALRVSPLAVGATLRIHDSIQRGVSRFYAEIERLKLLKDLTADELPLLFLLDELLHGTNSADRRVGAAAILRSLLDAGAIGLATTHDLALTQIVDELDPLAANSHFADELVGGELRFDYSMRPGVVQRSNALDLMRAVGLGV